MHQVAAWVNLPNASDRLKWYENKGLLQLWFIISILFVGEALDGYDGTLLSGLQALPKWKKDLGSPSASDIGLLGAARSLAGLVFGPASTYVANRWGRRWCLRFYGFTIALGAVVAVIAGAVEGRQGYALYCASQAIYGSGLAAGLQVSLVMLQEITHPRNRAAVAGLFDSNWALGQVLASLVVFGTGHIKSSWGWRIPVLLQIPFALYILFGTWFVDETPRWYMAKGMEAEAKAFLTKHANGDPNDELVEAEFAEIKGTIAAELAAGKVTLSKCLSGPGNLRRFGLLALTIYMSQLNGSRIIQTYYTVALRLSGITATSTLTGIGVGLTMFGFLMQLVGCWAIRVFNRRTLVLWTWPYLIMTMVGLTVSGYSFSASHSKNLHAGIASVAMVWLFNAGNQAISPLFFSYPAEILPYNLRAPGMAFWTALFQISGVFSNYVNSIALAHIGWKYYLVYLCIMITQFPLAYFFMVETKGYTLEEIAIAFEGTSAKVVIPDAEAVKAGHSSEEGSEKDANLH